MVSYEKEHLDEYALFLLYQAFVKYLYSIQYLLDGLQRRGMQWHNTYSLLEALEQFRIRYEQKLDIHMIKRKDEDRHQWLRLRIYSKDIAKKINLLKQDMELHSNRLSSRASKYTSSDQTPAHSLPPALPWINPQVRLQGPSHPES